MPAKVYTNKDANLSVLKNKTLAVLGYGSQGHAHAQNLKDSGLKVIIGLYPKSKSIKIAKKQGFEVYDVPTAVGKADVIMIAVPDMVQPDLYKDKIAPYLTSGKTIVFSHGFSITFQSDQTIEEDRCYYGCTQGSPGKSYEGSIWKVKEFPLLSPSRRALQKKLNLLPWLGPKG